ncbi:MAG: hypothetical protein Q8L37_05895 [Candidatus Gottesmanbacteria bacterium]|nr:hypothetical protein [Candidatus Gottesmanbacteria bacterium]
MHAYIITGGTTKERSEKIQSLLQERAISPHDITTILPDPSTIGIDPIRAVLPRLSVSPMGGTTHAVIIHLAHTMTPEAQNAFLKTLEEPPGEAIIYLETDQPEALLPTILSRCQIIRLTDNSDRVSPCQKDLDASAQCLKTIYQLLAASVGERLKIIDISVKTRDDALAFVNQCIQSLHHHLRMTGSRPVTLPPSLNLSQTISAKLLRSLLTARTQIQGNITPKLALDAVFLS